MLHPLEDKQPVNFKKDGLSLAYRFHKCMCYSSLLKQEKAHIFCWGSLHTCFFIEELVTCNSRTILAGTTFPSVINMLPGFHFPIVFLSSYTQAHPRFKHFTCFFSRCRETLLPSLSLCFLRWMNIWFSNTFSRLGLWGIMSDKYTG